MNVTAINDMAVFEPPCIIPTTTVKPPPLPEVQSAAEAQCTLLDIVELVLKNPDQLNRIVRHSAQQARLIPQFLAIGLIGFSVFAVGLTVTLNSTARWPKLRPIADWIGASASNASSAATGSGMPLLAFVPDTNWLGRWYDGSALKLLLAYSLGMVVALGICLPSYYFFALLAGVRTTVLEVTAHAMKGLATTAIALIGIVPIYLAVSLGFAIFQAPDSSLSFVLSMGLILPFIAGLFGVKSLYAGLLCLADTLPPERREDRRCFLRRLLFSWSSCYTAVCPVMIFTLWEQFGR